MNQQLLTLSRVVSNPTMVTEIVRLLHGEALIYRPLLPTDVDLLTEFLESLSPRTRYFWNVESYDRTEAERSCDAINRYDKLRMVAVENNGAAPCLAAIVELAFGLGSEIERYRSYGVEITEVETCRFGPCVRDSFQRRGLGSALMPATLRIVSRFGKSRVVLWGGVLADNVPAIRFYEKHGFRLAGSFTGPDGRESLDMILDR